MDLLAVNMTIVFLRERVFRGEMFASNSLVHHPEKKDEVEGLGGERREEKKDTTDCEYLLRNVTFGEKKTFLLKLKIY